LEQGYIDVFNPEALPSDATTMEKLIRREFSTPLGLTNFSIDVESGWQKDPLIYVLNPKVPADLIDYWNMRITTSHVIPVNVHWFEQALDLIREIIERTYRPLPGNPHGVMIRATLENGVIYRGGASRTACCESSRLTSGFVGPQTLVHSAVGQGR
jgi:hypothetical protein